MLKIQLILSKKKSIEILINIWFIFLLLSISSTLVHKFKLEAENDSKGQFKQLGFISIFAMF